MKNETEVSGIHRSFAACLSGAMHRADGSLAGLAASRRIGPQARLSPPLTVAIIAAALAGCSSIPGDVAAIAKDTKSGSVVCTKFQGLWGSGTIVVANLEQGVIRNGAVTVSQECGSIGISNQQSPPAAMPIPKEPAK